MSLFRHPDWNFWLRLRTVRLDQAVWLTLDLDPNDPKAESPDDEYISRLGLVKAWLNQDGWSQVELAEVALVAHKKEWSLPAEYPSARNFQTAGGWPWGTHTTRYLDILAEAGRRWWSNYDPSDKTTAPTNFDVARWLKEEKGVSPSMAAKMATILRANDLPAGPRT